MSYVASVYDVCSSRARVTARLFSSLPCLRPPSVELLPAMAGSKVAKKDRQELPPPPLAWISWAVLFAYVSVGIEGAVAICRFPWHTAVSVEHFYPGDEAFLAVQSGQLHLCLVYAFEALMALGPGYCAMSPGWTKFELFVHHVPYIAAVGLAYFCGHSSRWTAPLCCVLLTPANEGLFIAQSLGAPDWLAKARRLYGFMGISILFSCETMTVFRNMFLHHQAGWTSMSIKNCLIDQICWGGISYHFMLLQLYIKRWRKTRSL